MGDASCAIPSCPRFPGRRGRPASIVLQAVALLVHLVDAICLRHAFRLVFPCQRELLRQRQMAGKHGRQRSSIYDFEAHTAAGPVT